MSLHGVLKVINSISNPHMYNTYSFSATLLSFYRSAGLSAEIERTLLSERTKQGLERARKQGKQIGRKKGQKSRHYKLTGKAAYIKRQRLIGRSKNSLSKEFGVTWTTLNNFMHSKSIV